MSRSYKKVYSFFSPSGARKFFKRLSNKKIRRYGDVPVKFGRWKHISKQAYNICDYRWVFYSREDMIDYYTRASHKWSRKLDDDEMIKELYRARMK